MNGHSDNNGNLIARGIITLAGLILIAYLGWLGTTAVRTESEVSALSAKLDIVLADRQARIAREKP